MSPEAHSPRIDAHSGMLLLQPSAAVAVVDVAAAAAPPLGAGGYSPLLRAIICHLLRATVRRLLRAAIRPLIPRRRLRFRHAALDFDTPPWIPPRRLRQIVANTSTQQRTGKQQQTVANRTDSSKQQETFPSMRIVYA